MFSFFKTPFFFKSIVVHTELSKLCWWKFPAIDFSAILDIDNSFTFARNSDAISTFGIIGFIFSAMVRALAEWARAHHPQFSNLALENPQFSSLALENPQFSSLALEKQQHKSCFPSPAARLEKKVLQSVARMVQNVSSSRGNYTEWYFREIPARLREESKTNIRSSPFDPMIVHLSLVVFVVSGGLQNSRINEHHPSPFVYRDDGGLEEKATMANDSGTRERRRRTGEQHRRRTLGQPQTKKGRKGSDGDGLFADAESQSQGKTQNRRGAESQERGSLYRLLAVHYSQSRKEGEGGRKVAGEAEEVYRLGP
nr:hypothetical protein Iba_chr04aCG17890 [Ipomoea batatas]